MVTKVLGLSPKFSLRTRYPLISFCDTSISQVLEVDLISCARVSNINGSYSLQSLLFVNKPPMLQNNRLPLKQVRPWEYRKRELCHGDPEYVFIVPEFVNATDKHDVILMCQGGILC